MKLNIKKVITLIVILIAIGGIIFFLIRNQNKNILDNNHITYQKVTMITNLRLGVSEYDNINPIVTQNRDIIQINHLIFEPLLNITEDYQITTCLAKEWSKVDEKSYIIKLNENIKWHDGVKFTAQDVKFTIETIQQGNSIYVENVEDIKTIEIIDNYTIRINLNKEIPFFEYNLTFPIISAKQYSNKDISKSTDIPLGTGKYRINKMEEKKIELVKNEEYRNISSENVNIETIIITKYETMGEIYNAFKNDKLDFFQTTNQNLEEYIGSMGYQKEQFKGREYDYLAINCENEILKNKEVRQAIFYRINQEEIISSIFEGKVYSSYFPLDYGNYIVNDINLKNNSNEEMAKEVLKNAGWSYEYDTWFKEVDGSKKELEFTIAVSKNNKQRVKVAEKIKEQLEKIGIKIKVNQISDKMYNSYLENHNYELLLTGVYNSYSLDLTTFLGEGNISNFKNNEVTTLLNEVKNITDATILKEKYQKIFEIYQDEVPFVGLYRNKNTVIYSNNLMGDVTPNNYSLFYKFADWYRR